MIKVRIPLKVYSVNFVFEMNKNKVSNPRPLSRVLIARYSSSLQQWSRRFLIYRFGREVIVKNLEKESQQQRKQVQQQKQQRNNDNYRDNNKKN